MSEHEHKPADAERETATCDYCGAPFVVLPHHRAQGLLPYCSFACQAAVELGAGPSEHGRVDFDYADWSEARHDHRDNLAVCFDDDAIETASAHMMDVFASALNAMLQLRPRQFEVVAMRFINITDPHRFTYGEIARKYNVSTQAVEKIHRSAIRAYPALQAMFHRKLYKQSMRKVRTNHATRASGRLLDGKACAETAQEECEGIINRKPFASQI